MSYLYNNPYQKDLRKKLRNDLGLPEIVLWSYLKGNQLGVKFRRQYGISQYCLDFYCPLLRLGIELDGNTHDNVQAADYDAKRQESIEGENIKVIRFTNKEVLNNIEGVLAEIKKYIS